jgi:hypothetical protein
MSLGAPDGRQIDSQNGHAIHQRHIEVGASPTEALDRGQRRRRRKPKKKVGTRGAGVIIFYYLDKNFLTTSLTARPHMMALTIEEKLSSIKTMEEASHTTLVPEIPIERPISAAARVGASLVPSLVTTTISPISLSYVTRIHWSSRLDLTRTFRFKMI